MMYLTFIRRVRLSSGVPIRFNFHSRGFRVRLFALPTLVLPLEHRFRGLLGLIFLAAALHAKKYKPFLFRRYLLYSCIITHLAPTWTILHTEYGKSPAKFSCSFWLRTVQKLVN
jgi:hypothetical protein